MNTTKAINALAIAVIALAVAYILHLFLMH
jgi:hypothetical protein